ncbi:hypothetical protein O3P69_010138 [Scylla paramamosain]|uniref:Uncharacterized protein n=1 Tax=Scylla paramamosain TaxID=85552 RepID=A0AAW0TSV3_SCYPA
MPPLPAPGVSFSYEERRAWACQHGGVNQPGEGNRVPSDSQLAGVNKRRLTRSGAPQWLSGPSLRRSINAMKRIKGEGSHGNTGQREKRQNRGKAKTKTKKNKKKMTDSWRKQHRMETKAVTRGSQVRGQVWGQTSATPEGPQVIREHGSCGRSHTLSSFNSSRLTAGGGVVEWRSLAAGLVTATMTRRTRARTRSEKWGAARGPCNTPPNSNTVANSQHIPAANSPHWPHTCGRRKLLQNN